MYIHLYIYIYVHIHIYIYTHTRNRDTHFGCLGVTKLNQHVAGRVSKETFDDEDTVFFFLRLVDDQPVEQQLSFRFVLRGGCLGAFEES